MYLPPLPAQKKSCLLLSVGGSDKIESTGSRAGEGADDLVAGWRRRDRSSLACTAPPCEAGRFLALFWAGEEERGLLKTADVYCHATAREQ